MNRAFTLLFIASVILSVGCTSAVKNSMRLSEKSSQWNPLDKLTEKRIKERGESEPVTMAAIWKDTKVTVPGKPTMRGFGGRIYFYDKDNNPVKAEGEMVVYGFDNDSDDSTKPEKKFVFKQDDFQEHYSESALGASYSLWVPWDPAGGYQKSITLVPIFKTSDNRVIQTGQSINVLTGKRPVATNDKYSNLPYKYLGSSSAVIGKPGEKPQRPSGVTRASYAEDDLNPEDLNKIKLRVSSIPLTKNLQRMVKNAQTAASSDAGQIATPVPAGDVRQVDTSQSVDANATDGQPAAQPEKGVSRRVYGTPGPIYR